MENIKTCKDCNKILSRQNTSGYCRSCSPKHSDIDYSKRHLDYSKRKIDYDSMETLYEQDKDYNDRALMSIFAEKFLTYYKLSGYHTTIPFSHQKQIDWYGETTTLRALNLLKSSGAIKSTGLVLYQDYKTNEYAIIPEKLESLKFNWKENRTKYLVHYFGKPKVKRTTKKALTFTNQELDLVEGYLSQGSLLEDKSDRKVTMDSFLEDIEKYCQNSGKFQVTKEGYFKYLVKALKYGKVNGTDIVFRPKRKAIKDNKGNIVRYDWTIRFWNPICDTRNEEHSTERAEFLKSKGLDNFYHWDVPSSIPNTINWYKTGKWEPIDWHTRMAEKTGFTRDMVKYLALPCCFAAQNYNVDKLVDNLEYHTSKGTERGKEFSELRKSQSISIDQYKPGLKVMLDTYKTTKPKYLFWLESILYLEVWEKLNDMGIKCFMVFDSFYTDKEVDIPSIIQEVAKEINLVPAKDIKVVTKVEKKVEKKPVDKVVVEKKVIKPVVSKVVEKKLVQKVDKKPVEVESNLNNCMYQLSWGSLL